jgi:hypothetical protein
MVGGTPVEIATPFPSPGDWRDQWIYFLMVDRFNNPQAPPRFAPFPAIATPQCPKRYGVSCVAVGNSSRGAQSADISDLRLGGRLRIMSSRLRPG